MGSDATGILFYGIPMGDKYDWEAFQQMKEKANAMGNSFSEYDFLRETLSDIKPPDKDFPSKGGFPQVYTEDEKLIIKQYEKYWKEDQTFHKALPIEINTSSTYEYPILFISIKGAIFSADWGDFTEITTLNIAPEWDNILKEYCDKLGINYEQPRWYLTAFYG